VACPFNGLIVDDPTVVERTPLAVQIENHPAARPTSNLTRADMVVEAPVEGDITRYTAIFLCRATEGLTGPVRSGRYYLIDLWQDMHVLPYFFGSSSEAIARYVNAGMPFVNGISGGWPGFQRAGTNVAPHNLYSDIEAVRDAFGSHERLDGVAARVGELRPPFRFNTVGSVPPGRAVATLEIRTNSYWRFGWRWDASIGAWRRLEAGVDHIDAATGEPITAVSVIVQRVEQEIVYDDPDPGGNTRRYQHLVGEGPATLYVGGEAIALHWSRPTADDQTTWTYADSGRPVVLPAGQVWWQIVPTTASVTET
jgi:hypothetical protein